jgi:hypothetical protein
VISERVYREGENPESLGPLIILIGVVYAFWKHRHLLALAAMAKVITPAKDTREVNFKLLLSGLFLLILGGPVLRQYMGWEDTLVVKVIFGSSSILFVTSLTHDSRAFLVALLPALATLVFALLSIALDDIVYQYLMVSTALIFFLVAIKYASYEVFLSGPINFNKIIGSVCIYLLLIVSWALIYEFLELTAPGSFVGLPSETGLSRFDEFTYFSIVTITTLGYGDISPVKPVSGAVAGIEAIAGVFYIAILVASLVGDFMSRRGPGGHT